MSIYDRIERDIDSRNDSIRDKHGVRYVLCFENIFDEFCEDNELNYDDLSETEDLEGTYWALYLKWGKTQFTAKQIEELADETRRDNAADLRTQAMEMGYNNYSSENGGTYWRD